MKIDPFWIVGAVGLAVFAGYVCCDVIRKRAYDRGFNQGRIAGMKQSAEHSYNQGVMDGFSWIVRVEDDVEAEKRKMWEGEIGA